MAHETLPDIPVVSMECAFCPTPVKLSLEQLDGVYRGSPPVCAACAAKPEGERGVAKPQGTWHCAAMPCRVCAVRSVLLPRSEAAQLMRANRRPLCAVCLVEVEGPRWLREYRDDPEMVAQLQEKIRRAQAEIKNAKTSVALRVLQLHHLEAVSVIDQASKMSAGDA